MKLDQQVQAALARLSQQVSVAGPLPTHLGPVGQCNQLNGRAWYVDFGPHRFVVLANADGKYFSCGLTSGTDLGDTWPIYELEDVVASQASWLKKFLPANPPWSAPVGLPLPPLPHSHYDVLAAALSQRVQNWNLSRVFLKPVTELPRQIQCDRPDLDPTALQDWLGHDAHYAVDLSRLHLPWPVTAVPEGDFLEFYGLFPTAHGHFAVSPVGFAKDGSQAVVWLEHCIGPQSFGAGFWPPRDEASLQLPGNFEECLVLKKTQENWQLFYPAVTTASNWELTEQLQSELSPWAQIESVVIEEGAICQALIRTSRGRYRVLLVKSSWSTVTSLEPAIVVFGEQLTGSAIREGFDGQP